MKNILLIMLSYMVVNSIQAQVAIGKNTVDGAGILDFASGTTNGIILPIVQTISDSTVNGTLLMSKLDKKLKVKQNDRWMDLSDPGSIDNVVFSSSSDNGKGIIIGALSSSAEGILVLESTDKALILPKVQDPHLNVKSPYPGMICYDTASKTIALFDGLKWNYWK
ncbi:hypothetical protein O2K51_06025 [Apibacter raozihei]|uniref:hypothetical protein n=1 Tax=Apibacter raozihei TaxID=2500547 RepID=UPI000FE41670|nr:hypothetical protein [Apibacter raozihei]